jgi:putative redox protein
MTTSNASTTADSASSTGAPWITARTGAASYRTDISAGGHDVIADEPATNGDSDGPSPYELLLSAIGACTAMTMRMYANRKQWPLEEVTVRLRSGRKHAEDCANCERQAVGIQQIERQVEMKGDLTDEQRERLLYIADRCPVKQTLERGIKVVPADS